MGVGLSAAIGVEFANPGKPAVCLTGDGGLVTCIHELHTAAEYDPDVTVVVSNDADYGALIEGEGSDEASPAQTSLVMRS